ncbi:MAG: orotidine-5'-phosphate decarboxylase [Lactimicrobium sp.]|jgi:orotidine-5'-phosphate decarboxylase|uniref:orotidine-5'-phosphate decarboxylase n=1 Tax=Lactimicrobium sp. TaxID=2563780 RepID=UPI002F354AEE
MSKDVIIACDFASKKETLTFLERFGEVRPFVKIGMELFYSEGPDIVRELKQRGHQIFLDLKLHDIPNTVEKTCRVLAGLDVDMVNVHAAGTIAMMQAARRGLSARQGKQPLLIAVTQLTSTDQNALENELDIHEDMQDVVMHYAMNAKAAGLDGVVCSPWEADKVHQTCGNGFVTVTPGIRFASSKKDDQKRIMTPAQAKTAGCDYIVVGRPITQAEDPVAAYRECVREFKEETR